MNGLLANVEVVLGLRFKQDVPETVMQELKWATHRKMYFDNKVEFHKHPFAWIFHSRVGKFAGYHASRVWLTPKTGYWHLSAHFSCNNFTRAVNELLRYLEPHVAPEGFAGYIIPEDAPCPVLVYFFAQSGVILQEIRAADGIELDKLSMSELE